MALSRNDEPEVLIVAAEASSALYARRLLEYWRQVGARVKAFGIGSEDMEALGFERLGRSEDLAVVGLTEVLKHYPKIKSVFESLVEEAKKRRPQVILLLDYPDFNLRLAKKLKPLGIPIIYYISPQVWAWRKSRIHDIKKLVDKMLVVLPFEKDFYRSHGVEVEFVGHPLLDELKPKHFEGSVRKELRQRYGVQDNDFCVGLMPGSRHSELRHHLELQVRVAEDLHARDKNLKFALLVAPTFSIKDVREMLPPYSIPMIIIKEDPLKMVSLVDAALCASGTATLVVGLLKKPMVVMYRMNPVSAFLAKLFVKGTSEFALINLILSQRVVPELFQGEANLNRLTEEMMKIIQDESYREEMIQHLSKARDILGLNGATARVAKALEPYIF